jgi:hypothetical protein
MDPTDDTARQARQTFLTIFLTGLLGVFCLLVLILISGGFFFYVLLVGLGMTAAGLLHYLAWGRAFSEEVAGEREEEQLRERAQAEEWPLPERHTFRR